MSECIVLSEDADALQSEIRQLDNFPLQCYFSETVEDAVRHYVGQRVLFGDPDLLAAALPDMPGVDWVQSTWAGIRPLLQGARRDYVLTNIKDVFGTQISEFVFAYLLAHELRLFERASRQQQHDWYQRASGTLQRKRLGIMGTGSIGSSIASTAALLGMQVVGLNRSGSKIPGFAAVFTTQQIDDFLADLDYVVSVLPQTEETDQLLNNETLAALPNRAYFINVGRGNVVDNDALIAALSNRSLAGAVLDVFDEEPVPADSRLWDTPNLLMTAHIAALSHASLIVPVFAENTRRYASRQPLMNVVDFVRGY